MAGILPTAIHKGKRYYLIGRESKFPESGLYADFGGHKDKGESILNTAIREGFEETIGIIGDKKKIGSLIKLNGKLNIHHALPLLFVLITDLTLFLITCFAITLPLYPTVI